MNSREVNINISSGTILSCLSRIISRVFEEKKDLEGRDPEEGVLEGKGTVDYYLGKGASKRE